MSKNIFSLQYLLYEHLTQEVNDPVIHSWQVASYPNLFAEIKICDGDFYWTRVLILPLDFIKENFFFVGFRNHRWKMEY